MIFLTKKTIYYKYIEKFTYANILLQMLKHKLVNLCTTRFYYL